MQHGYNEGYSDAGRDIDDEGIVFAEFIRSMFDTGSQTEYSRGYAARVQDYQEVNK